MTSPLRRESRLLRRSAGYVSSPPTTTGEPRDGFDFVGESSGCNLRPRGVERVSWPSSELLRVCLARMRARRNISAADVPCSAVSKRCMIAETEGKRVRMREPKE